MRKITEESVNAFFRGESFHKANMDVSVNDGWVGMFLHGNLIAERTPENGVTLHDAGWESNTTKERLNGILAAFGWGIGSDQGEWVLWPSRHGESLPWRGSVKVADLVTLDTTIQSEKSAR